MAGASLNMPRFPRNNNIQWLRLFFALQVVIVHAIDRVWLVDTRFIRYAPGVPAFFFVSGFLIYSSWCNAPGMAYFQNRFLRIWPALAFVTCGGALIALGVRGVHDFSAHTTTYLIWIVSQVTLGQWYNPQIFRNIGSGVINGALWTITTEIIFYAFVPIIAFFERKIKYAIPLFIALSFSLYVVGPQVLGQRVYGDKTFYDVLGVTPLVWGWMFGFGMLAVKYFNRIQPYFRYFPIAIVPLISLIMLGRFDDAFFGCMGNRLGILYFVPYCMIIIYLAFQTPFIKLDTDLSYGIYIWHMPIINVAIVVGVKSPLIILPVVICMGAFSWFLIERPALRLKRKSIHKV